ncbi:8438_t:CDS:2 [Dentiscutata erythropus]|uniref:8438_t:CDS:1 n=1 Tax=Dentiscutata erythropus TaxID=1348616 RepID=A0A9N9AVW0_9GLOM|nr:8438_t:CDS:2 [Dentiscutata erythropus]
MASSSKSAENLNKHEKRCTRCGKLRVIEDFIRQVGDRLNENATSDVDDNISEERIPGDNRTLYDLSQLEDIIANNFMDIDE